MEISYQIELTAVVLGTGLFIVWLIRMESKLLALEKDFEKEIIEIKVKHEKEITSLVENSRSNSQIVWDKIDSLQKMITEVIKSLGRLEGKMESKG